MLILTSVFSKAPSEHPSSTMKIAEAPTHSGIRGTMAPIEAKTKTKNSLNAKATVDLPKTKTKATATKATATKATATKATATKAKTGDYAKKEKLKNENYEKIMMKQQHQKRSAAVPQDENVFM